MNIALILAGGFGTRMGFDLPKQYIEVLGKPVIGYCLDTFLEQEEIDKIQIVAEKEWHGLILHCLKTEGMVPDKFAGFSIPGKNRQLSILNGLTDILKYADEMDSVVIHDAARPLVKSQLISDCLDALKHYEGVLPVLPMKDTVYEGKEGKITALLDRSRIWAGQAPEAFLLGRYYRANVALLPDAILQINGSTEPAILAGMNLTYITGDEDNFKITTKADLERFEQIVEKVTEKSSRNVRKFENESTCFAWNK